MSRAYKIVSGDPTLVWGCALDLDQPLRLPIPSNADISVIEGGEGNEAVRLELVADATDARACPARVWRAIKPLIRLEKDRAIPVPNDHPGIAETVKRCLAALGPAPKGSSDRDQWIEEGRDIFVRSGRLPDAVVIDALGLRSGEPLELALSSLAELRTRGLSFVGHIAADVDDDLNRSAVAAAMAQTRAAEAEKKLTTIHSYHGRWARVTIRRRRDDLIMRSLFMTPTEPGIYSFSTCGLPIPAVETLLAPGISICLATTLQATEAGRAAASAPLPDGIAFELRGILESTVTRYEITEDELDGDLRDETRYFHGALFRGHVEELVRLVRVAPRGPLAELAAAALWQLPLAYSPHVSIDDAIVWTENALRCEAAKVKSSVMGLDGTATPLADPPHPTGFPHPSSVAAKIRAACFPLIRATPAVWALGACTRKPTEAEAREVKLTLHPNLAEDTIRAVVAGRDVISTKEVWAALKDAEISVSDTPTPETRRWVSKALVALGFTKIQHRAPDGSRARLWVAANTPIATLDAVVAAARGAPVGEPIDLAFGMRGPLKAPLVDNDVLNFEPATVSP